MAIGQILRFRWRLTWLMALIAIVAVGLIVAREYRTAWYIRYQVWAANRAVRAQLDRHMDLSFGDGVPVEGLLAFVQKATRSSEFPKGVPIYIDEIGFQEANNATPSSVVRIDAKNAPIGESLRKALDPLDLDWCVRDGILQITSKEEAALQDGRSVGAGTSGDDPP